MLKNVLIIQLCIPFIGVYMYNKMLFKSIKTNAAIWHKTNQKEIKTPMTRLCNHAL